MKPSEVRNLDREQLGEKLQELRHELFNLRFQQATRQLTNTARLRQVRRDIARVVGRLRELEMQGVEA